MPIGTYVSIITLNVNGLNSPTKRYRLTEWIQKQTPNNQENANRNIRINNYLKYKWIKCTNQKIQTD